MVDFSSTQARTKGVAPSTNHKGGQAMAAVATPLNDSITPHVSNQ
jgi:hypothetical protein